MIYVNHPTEFRPVFVAEYRDADVSATGEDQDDALRALAKALDDRISSFGDEPATIINGLEREKLRHARDMTVRWYQERGDDSR